MPRIDPLVTKFCPAKPAAPSPCFFIFSNNCVVVVSTSALNTTAVPNVWFNVLFAFISLPVVTNTSPEEVKTKNPPKVYEYVTIDWDNLLESCQNQSERDRIFIDTLRYIGDEVFENYKESIESSFDISPILEKHYDFLVETWEQDCPEKYDIDDKLIDNLYNIVNNSFDAIISS